MQVVRKLDNLPAEVRPPALRCFCVPEVAELGSDGGDWRAAFHLLASPKCSGFMEVHGYYLLLAAESNVWSSFSLD